MKTKRIKRIQNVTGSHRVRDLSVPSEHYLLANHVITHNSGGGGLKYAASTIVYLSKKKLRDEDDKTNVIGSILTATLEKSRFTRYGKQVELLLTHEAGLDKYWGLFDLGKESGLLVAGTGKTKGNGIEVNYYQFPDGQIASRKEIEENPVQYFEVAENIAAFEELCARTFRFGKTDPPIEEPEEEIAEEA